MIITDHLRHLRVHHELVLHRPASCASRLASCLGVPGREVAKGVLLTTGSTYLLAVVPSTHRVNLERLAEILGLDHLRIGTAPDLVKVFHDCELGAVPPFGGLYGVPTIADTSLAAFANFTSMGNLRHQSLRMRYKDYESIVEPVRIKCADPADPAQGKQRRRRAG